MKICTCCGQTKDEDEFPYRAGQHSKCRACHNAVQYRYQKNHPESKRRIRKDRVQRNRDLLREYKEQHSCEDCGGRFPAYVMDFHHVGIKKHSMSRLLATGCAWEKVMAEINACVLLCSNCHRIRHKGRPNQWNTLR